MPTTWSTILITESLNSNRQNRAPNRQTVDQKPCSRKNQTLTQQQNNWKKGSSSPREASVVTILLSKIITLAQDPIIPTTLIPAIPRSSIGDRFPLTNTMTVIMVSPRLISRHAPHIPFGPSTNSHIIELDAWRSDGEWAQVPLIQILYVLIPYHLRETVSRPNENVPWRRLYTSYLPSFDWLELNTLMWATNIIPNMFWGLDAPPPSLLPIVFHALYSIRH